MKRRARAKRGSGDEQASKQSIVAFCCENSGYKAAESVRGHAALAPVRLVKVPCAGKVEIVEILKCFEAGAEHVLVVGCPLDNCKHINGSRRAAKRVAVARKALKDAGLDEQRARMEFVASIDGAGLIRVLETLRSAATQERVQT